MNANGEAILIEEIVDATVKWDEKRCVELARQAVEKGIDPLKVIQDGCSRGCKLSARNFQPWSTVYPRLCWRRTR